MIRSVFTGCLCGFWLVLAVGCGSREHMSEDYGRKSRAFFEKQRVHAVAADGSPAGLDTEEAAAVRNRYQKSLEPEKARGDNAASSRVLVLEDADDKKD